MTDVKHAGKFYLLLCVFLCYVNHFKNAAVKFFIWTECEQLCWNDIYLIGTN